MTVDAAKLDTKVFVSKIGHSLGCQDLRVKVLKQRRKTLWLGRENLSDATINHYQDDSSFD